MAFARAALLRSFDGSDASFLSSRVELQWSLRIGHTVGFLVARGLVHHLEPVGSDPVPFQRLLSNAGADLFRGYLDSRWRDRGVALANMEVHWGVWASANPLGPTLDAYLLTDVGQVFGDPVGVALGDLAYSHGAGLRLASALGFAGIVEFARSREDSVIRLRDRKSVV